MTNKVVTITLNPAFDLTGHLGKLDLGRVNLVQQSDLHAAGKGVNVAKILSELGALVTVTGFLGQDNQTPFCQLFEQVGLQDEFVRIKGATRINVKLIDQHSVVTDINFPGITITQPDIEAFETTLWRLAQDHDYFVLAGSLPQGISPQQCAKWIAQLRSMNKKVLFDSSREALIVGCNAKPWLIKPNDEELAQWCGRELSTLIECQHAAADLANKGIEHIMVSMGAEGVIWLHEQQWLHAKPPKMPIVSTVGAGDTLVAGFCWGHMQAMDKPSLLRFTTALSAMAVTQVGVGIGDRNELAALMQQVQLSELNIEK